MEQMAVRGSSTLLVLVLLCGCADESAPAPLGAEGSDLVPRALEPQARAAPGLGPSTPCFARGCVGVAELAAGRSFSCALLGNGRVACWGGPGGGGVRSVPALRDAITIAAGPEHACVVVSGGGVECWRAGAPGVAPRTVSGIEDALSVAVGQRDLCAVTGEGRVLCAALEAGAAAPDADRRATGARELPAIRAALEIESAGGRFCVLDSGGGVSCVRETDGHAERWPIADVRQIALGEAHQCALREGGRVLCWGSDEWGMVGDGGAGVVEHPVEIADAEGALAIEAGAQHTCALVPGNEVRCWGRNHRGQVDPSRRAFDDYLAEREPVEVTGLSTIRDVIGLAAGEAHTCATRARGGAICWGSNREGQLGDGTSAHRDEPVFVRGLAPELPGR